MDEKDREEELGKRLNEEIESYEDEENDSLQEVDKEEITRDIENRLEKRGRKQKKDQIFDLARDRVSRRDFLKFMGLSAGIGAASSFGITKILKYHRQFADGKESHITGFATSSAIDITDQGVSTDGGVLNDALEGNQGQNIIIPEGNYQIRGGINLSNTKVKCKGATIKVPDHVGPVGPTIFSFSGNDWVWGGDCVIDQSGEQSHARYSFSGNGQFGTTDGCIRIKGVGDVTGTRNPNQSSGHKHTMTLNNHGGQTIKLVNIDDHYGTGNWWRLDSNYNPDPNGNWYYGTNAGLTWTNMSGTLEMENCWWGPHGNNIFYLKAMRGRCVVRNCVFDRPANAGLRIGCDGGAKVVNTLFNMDTPMSRSLFYSMANGNSGRGQRGGYSQNRGGGVGNIVFRGIDSATKSNDVVGGDLFFLRYPTTLTIEDSRVEMQNGGAPLYTEGSGTINAKNCHFSGNLGTMNISNGTFENCHIEGGRSKLSGGVNARNISSSGVKKPKKIKTPGVIPPKPKNYKQPNTR